MENKINKKNLAEFLNIPLIEATKIEMSILYLLGKANSINKRIYKTMIYKFISFLELRATQKYTNHFFMMDFVAWEWGSVPYSFMKYVDEYNNNFSYFDYKKTNDNKIIFSLKNNNDYKKYFNWDYFSEIDKKILIEITNFILEENKTVRELSDILHEKSRSWQFFWDKRKNKKQNKMNFSLDINFDNENEEEKTEIINFYKESCYKNDKY
ncbi:hypothetical protein [Spiroplasma endosymbiont of Villa modesta]|uniref:hypothetical protein n=1 Tax=Spiroplasma endosymbiont of Villa modesta TaxID=3066293 RepID=UPI00313CDE08